MRNIPSDFIAIMDSANIFHSLSFPMPTGEYARSKVMLGVSSCEESNVREGGGRGGEGGGKMGGSPYQQTLASDSDLVHVEKGKILA